MLWKTRLVPLAVAGLALFIVSGCADPGRMSEVAQAQLDADADRQLSLIRQELAHPALQTPTYLADIRTTAIGAYSAVAAKRGAASGSDAEVSRLYTEGTGFAATDLDRLAQMRIALSNYYAASNRPGRAIPLLQEDLAYQRQKGDRFQEARTLDALASANSDAGNLPGARRYRAQALEVLAKFLGPEVATTSQHKPLLWLQYQKVLMKAVSDAVDDREPTRIARYEPLVLKISKTFLKPEFVTYIQLANQYAVVGDLGHARRLFAEAQKTFEAERSSMTPDVVRLSEIDFVCAQSEIETTASAQRQEALRDACLSGKAANGLDLSIGDRLRAGLAYERIGATEKALATFETAAAQVNALRDSFTVSERVAFMNNAAVQKIYWGRIRNLSRSLRAQNNNSESAFLAAFAAADEYRARQLGEVVGVRLTKGISAYRSYFESLPPDGLAIGVTVMDDRTVVFAAGRGVRRFAEVPIGRQEMERRVRALLDKLSDPRSNPQLLETELRSYTAALLGEVRPLLQGRHGVILALDGPSALLPPSLLYPDDVSPPIAGTADVSVTPAFRFLASNESARRADGLLAFGDAAFPPEIRIADGLTDSVTRGPGRPSGRLRNLRGGGVSVPPLPETREEVEAIGRLFPGKSRIVLGAQATRSAVLQANFDGVGFLHIATHGLLPGDVSGLTEPALVLAPGSDLDPLLRSSDAEKLDLRAVDLTVLSACNTGSGQVYSGEGVMGLSRAFLAAGSRSVIVSMWPVASKETEALMVKLYQRRQDGSPLPAALREAMTALRQIRPHPMYWAPFVIIRTN